ncbi:Metallo-dependent hydrolase [Dichomitus squalens]|uniref:Metallo-dependent hydrolase n=1 Tax=Dichomitus squalens TaxID=114155 RepID=A0A4Q9PWG9_9APHY|nr:Metallo-dependent hydrolase [Dichomitus squalens]
MVHTVHGPAANALASLTPHQLDFLKKLPKAELHAHLNGSIPFPILQQLAQERETSLAHADEISNVPEIVRAGLEKLKAGVVLDQLHDFFDLFPAIYALTSNPAALARATRGVLEHFLEEQDGCPQAAYIELRSIPRETPEMTRRKYIETVLDEIERYPPERAAYIVALDRRMESRFAAECVQHAIELKNAGRRIVGIDLCGDPTAGNITEFAQYFRQAKEAGLGLTLHIAEVKECPPTETLQLLSFKPDRLGHATFLDDEAKRIVHTDEMCIEICLSSNLLCKTVPTLDVHHIRYYLSHNHPIAICTDDILPFRNSLVGEYALLMATPPLGLGLEEAEIEKIAKMGMNSRFR